jgi:hypothetical protein
VIDLNGKRVDETLTVPQVMGTMKVGDVLHVGYLDIRSWAAIPVERTLPEGMTFEWHSDRINNRIVLKRTT